MATQLTVDNILGTVIYNRRQAISNEMRVKFPPNNIEALAMARDPQVPFDYRILSLDLLMDSAEAMQDCPERFDLSVSIAAALEETFDLTQYRVWLRLKRFNQGNAYQEQRRWAKRLSSMRYSALELKRAAAAPTKPDKKAKKVKAKPAPTPEPVVVEVKPDVAAAPVTIDEPVQPTKPAKKKAKAKPAPTPEPVVEAKVEPAPKAPRKAKKAVAVQAVPAPTTKSSERPRCRSLEDLPAFMATNLKPQQQEQPTA